MPDSNSTPAPDGPVLICGGAGYIGSHTVRALRRLNVSTVTLDNLSTGHRALVQGPFEEVDLGDPEGVAAVFEKHRPKAVMHFAAKCYVGESVEKPSKYWRENVSNTLGLLDAMRAADCRNFVFSSTCATYGEPVEIPMTEAHPQNPINPYGRTKLVIEQMLSDYAHAYGLRYAALRYFNAAGASPAGGIGEDHEPETHLIPLVLQVAQEKRENIRVFGDDYPTRDGTCIRDYIHVDDLADAHLRALGKLQSGTPSLKCNLGTGHGYSVLELIETARKITGHRIPHVIDPRRPGDPAELVSGGQRALELLGWEPKRSALETILGDAWEFHTDNPGGFE